MCVGNFLKLLRSPIVVSEPRFYVLMLYARVEYKAVVGVDIVNLLVVTSLILIQRHRGMKRPGLTLHVRLRETGSTD